jgi:hypothetical protein
MTRAAKKKIWPRPKRAIVSWMDFILEEGAVPAVVEARNNSGGIYKGGRFTCWDFEGNFFAIWNTAGNPVWCHKFNLKLLSKGTVKTMQTTKFKSVKFVKDYQMLLKAEVPNCGLMPTYRR